MPYWEDTQPRISPDGTTRRLRRGRLRLARRRRRRRRRAGSSRAAARSGSTTRACSSRSSTRSRPTTTRLAVVDVADPWPRRLARATATSTRSATRGTPAVSPDGARGRVRLRPARRPQARRDPRRRHRDRPRARAHRHARHGGPRPRLVARRRDGRLRLGALRAGARCTPSAATATATASSPRDDADFGQLAWHPRRRRGSSRCAAAATASTSCSSTPADGRGRARSPPGGTWDAPAVDRRRRRRRGLRGPRDAGRAAPDRPAAEPHRTIHAPAPLSVKRAPHVAPEDVSFRSFDGLEIPAFLSARRTPRRTRRSPRSSIPTAARPTPTSTTGTATRSTSSTRATPGSRSNFRGSTGYGRDFERANHGVWGVEDTRDCLAAADYLRTLDWVDGDRLAIFGGSYGSYMATARGDRRPRAPLPLRGARSTATATSSRRGRRATARASRTSSG